MSILLLALGGQLACAAPTPGHNLLMAGAYMTHQRNLQDARRRALAWPAVRPPVVALRPLLPPSRPLSPPTFGPQPLAGPGRPLR